MINNRLIPQGEILDILRALLEGIMRRIGQARGNNTYLKYKAMLNILIALLLYTSNGYPMSYSRNNNSYANHGYYGQAHYTRVKYIPFIDSLIAHGLVHHKNGYYNRDGDDSYSSRLVPSEELLNLAEMNGLTGNNRFKHVLNYKGNSCYVDDIQRGIRQDWFTNQVILKLPLKDRHTMKELVSYTPTPKTRAYNDFLTQYNHFIRDIQLLLPSGINRLMTSLREERTGQGQQGSPEQAGSTHRSKPEETKGSGGELFNALQLTTKTDYCNSILCKEIEPRLYRVFNDKGFSLGGRFYGAGYQQIDSDQRSSLILDGSSVTEYDYSAFHTMMLYHLEEIDLTGDPYDLYNGDKIMRQAVKLMMNMAINAKADHSAISAFNDKLYSFSKPHLLKSPVNEAKAAKKQALHRSIIETMKQRDLKAKDILSKVKASHKQIEQYFCSGIGTSLQFEDSRLAEKILKHFTAKNIPCLCVHDSFLVQEQYGDELKDMMQTVYKERFNHDCRLSRKEKAA